MSRHEDTGGLQAAVTAGFGGLVVVALAVGALFRGCDPPPPPPSKYVMADATIVKVYKERFSWGDDWKTSVELANGVRLVVKGRLGDSGERVKVKVKREDIEAPVAERE